MAQSRRLFLKIAGASALTLGAAGAGLGVFAATRTPVRALVPWETAMSGAHGDARLRALAWAILAPNPHNIQPWLFELVGEDEVRVWHDPARRLPHTDPYDRQIMIGFGCMLELMRMAAAEAGLAARITPFPDGAGAPRLDNRPIAHVRFIPGGAQPDPLFAHAAARRSNKTRYDARPVPLEVLDAVHIAAAPRLDARLTNEPGAVAALKTLTGRALEVELITPRTFGESIDLMRFGKREIEAQPDGIAIRGAVLEGLHHAGILTRETLADPSSRAFRDTIEMYDGLINSARAFAVLVSPGASREDEIAAGRDWLRLNLAATSQGLGFHPLSQALQEFEEMAPWLEAAQDMLAPDGGRVQMIARMGYAGDAPRTPRWPLESRVMS